MAACQDAALPQGKRKVRHRNGPARNDKFLWGASHDAFVTCQKMSFRANWTWRALVVPSGRTMVERDSPNVVSPGMKKL